MRIAELLSELSKQTQVLRGDIEILLTFILNKPRSFLYAYSEYELTREQQKAFVTLYERRIEGEPIAYILGKKEFWSLELSVDKNVLIPRPETELLVEVALNKLPAEAAVIADLGTGSGAIALALASERPKWTIVATDISEQALQLARLNAMRLQLKNVDFYHSNWCEVLAKEQFAAIISNPPYIAYNDPHLENKDIMFEPKIALVAGDGLFALTKIIIQAKEKLKSGGVLILEHGYDQSEKVQDLMYCNNYKNIIPYEDLAGLYRMVVAEKSE